MRGHTRRAGQARWLSPHILANTGRVLAMATLIVPRVGRQESADVGPCGWVRIIDVADPCPPGDRGE